MHTLIKSSSFFAGMVIALIAITLLSSCKASAQKDNGIYPATARKSGADNHGTQKPTITTPVKKPAAVIVAEDKPVKRDTLVVLDTVASPKGQIVVRHKYYLGKNVGTDTIPVKTRIASIPNTAIKSQYRIAVLLPFYASQYARDENRTVPKKSKLALDLYEGVQLALQDLISDGSPINIYVADTEGDSATVEALFKKTEVTQADLIFGPIYTQEVRVAARLAKKLGKTMISPLSVKEELLDTNPLYIQMNPSLSAHYQGLLEYARNKYGNRVHVIAVTRENANDTMSLSVLKKVYKQTNTSSLPLNVVTATGDNVRWDDIKPYLSAIDSNVIFVTSQYDLFVNNTLHTIANNRDYELAVYGMPKWAEFATFNVDDYAKANVHISSGIYMDHSSNDLRQFRIRFYGKYKQAPGYDALRGYEEITAAVHMMKTYGTTFAPVATKTKPQLTTSIELFPVDTAGRVPAKSTVKYFENRYINVLRFDGSYYKKVN